MYGIRLKEGILIDRNIFIEKRDFRIKEKGLVLDVIHLGGSMDSYNFSKLEEVLEELIHEGHTRMIINMEKLEYISSAGLGVLIRLAHEFREKGGDIKLAHVSRKILEILKLISLDAILEIYQTEDEAAYAFTDAGKKAGFSRFGKIIGK